MGSYNLPILMTFMVVFVVGFTTLAEAQPTPSCAQALSPCADYINSTNPAPSCCNSIKDAVTNQLSCLCGLYSSGVLQSFGITVDQALNLSRNCGVTTDLSKCNATAPSPTSGSPPGVPGSDSAGRIGWTGFSTLFFSLASMMFY